MHVYINAQRRFLKDTRMASKYLYVNMKIDERKNKRPQLIAQGHSSPVYISLRLRDGVDRPNTKVYLAAKIKTLIKAHGAVGCPLQGGSRFRCGSGSQVWMTTTAYNIGLIAICDPYSKVPPDVCGGRCAVVGIKGDDICMFISGIYYCCCI
jgi:hypothetical protein